MEEEKMETNGENIMVVNIDIDIDNDVIRNTGKIKFYNQLIKKCNKFGLKIIYIINEYTNPKYLNTIFTIVYGSSFIILITTLISDIKPEMIPFKIVPIELYKLSALTKQLSILFTFISFITSNMLFMRIVLCLSFGIGIIALFLDSKPINLSFVVWNFLIFLINSKHVAIICYNMRHITFDNDRELIYTHIFKKLLSRSDYQILMNHSLIRTIKKNRYYINLDDTCDNLTILISGKMKKTDKKSKISYVKETTFVDSPEFIMRKHSVGQTFNISFYAETECKILLWPREMIIELIDKNKHLNSPLLAALGIDVSYKVFVLDILK